MPESTRLPASSAAVSAASPGEGSVNGMASEFGAREAGRRPSRAARVILPCLGLVGFGLGVALLPPAAFHWVFVSEFGPVELGTAACFGAATVLGLRPRGAKPGGRARGRSRALPPLRSGRPVRRARGDQLRTALLRVAESALVRRAERPARDQPPQPLRRQARQGAPQRRPRRRRGRRHRAAGRGHVGRRAIRAGTLAVLSPAARRADPARRRHAPDAPRPDTAPDRRARAGISGSTR